MANFTNVPTPWGKSQGGERMAEGIVLYHTAGHGGVKVVKKLNEEIPAGLRHERGWYEEDCDMLIPFYFHYEAIREYMTAAGAPEGDVEREGYFTRFTKEYLRRSLESSPYLIPACAYHFGTVYPEETLDEYGRDKLCAAFERIKRRERRVLPKKGDAVAFYERDGTRAYGGGVFIFAEGERFYASCGQEMLIRRWRKKDFETRPSS